MNVFTHVRVALNYPMDAKSVKLSKQLSYVLRHGAEEAGISIRSDGYVSLQELLNHVTFRRYHYTAEQIRTVVLNNDKQRFSLIEEDGVELIRANQGHTLSKVMDDELLELVKSPEDLPVCIHGTRQETLKEITEHGLNRMQRNHIHFIPGEPGSRGVISGLRSTSNVLIYIDVALAMDDGIKFYRSSNSVILSPGIDGVISPKYFKRIIHVQ